MFKKAEQILKDHGPMTKLELFRKLKEYQFNDVYVITGYAGFVFDLEKRLHSLLRPFRYQPSKHFHGHTECFSKIPKDVEKLLKTLENSQQIQLIA